MEIVVTEAKLFKVGGSQAVRLPKEFRIPGDRVLIRREGDKIILEPLPSPRGKTVEEIRAWLAGIQSAFEPDFMPEGRDQPPSQERDWNKFD
jgi:antitoxin VapB